MTKGPSKSTLIAIIVVNVLGIVALIISILSALSLTNPQLLPIRLASFEKLAPIFNPVSSLFEEQELQEQISFGQAKKIIVQSDYYSAATNTEALGIVEILQASDEQISQALNFSAQIIKKDTKSRNYTLFYSERFQNFLDDAQAQIDRPKAEGRWNFETKRAVAGIDGLRLDRQGSEKKLIEAYLSDADRFDLTVQVDRSLSKDTEALQDFEPKILIGRFKTTFSRSKNRTINVKLAAQALDGVLLAEGADFSYNELVGERSEERGYKEAPVIEQGQLVEGLGGGACQVSSTVHAAALLAGLDIVERHNHSLPSSYIAMGLDAVVAYPLLDLRVKNMFKRPVVLHVYTEDNTLIAEFFSDVESPRTVFRKEVTTLIPFQEILSFDPTLEENSFKITKQGRVGYQVSRGRLRWIDGKEEFEKLKLDIYQAQNQLVSVGPNTPYPPPEEGIE